MNQYIERYIYDVIHRLPKDEQEEVRKELISNIYEMLPDNPSESEVIHILNKMGSTDELANQYRQKPNYLISPKMYNEYISALKIVFIIITMVMFPIGVISDLLEIQMPVTWIEVSVLLVKNLFLASIIGALNSFLWVTIGAALADRSQGKSNEKGWNVNNLPDMPEQIDGKIPFGKTIIDGVVALIFNMILLGILIIAPEMIGWYDKGKSVISLFNIEVMQNFIPFILFMVVCSVGVVGFKLYYKQWNIKLAMISIVYNLICTFLIVNFINIPTLFNEQFLLRMGKEINVDPMTVASYWEKGILITSVAIIIIAGCDIISSILNTYKTKKVIR